MAKLYADEHYPLPVVERLRALGHDVLTVQAAGKAGLKIPNDEVLAFATSQGRAVLTLNRQAFKQLHRLQPDHAGITQRSRLGCPRQPSQRRHSNRSAAGG